uniref:Magnetosome protein MamN n=1 Tax=Candidatus Magnetananas rongchengensis TaxID=1463558 RepID=A0A3Q8BG50_9BACT|nr:magnetosome protein MamN [Candidatus Magnetananas rongchenensis]
MLIKHVHKKEKVEDNKINLKAVMLINIIFFLIVWSFFGKRIEQQYYGYIPVDSRKSGLEMIQNNSGELVVNTVQKHSPGEVGGIKAGDIIVGINGELITSPDLAAQRLDTLNKGEILEIVLNRDGRKITAYISNKNHMTINRASKSQELSFTARLFVMIICVKLTLVMFYLIYKNIINRMYIVLTFAAHMLLVGLIFGVYNVVDAFFAIKFNTISLLLGMGIISIVLDEAGVFDYVAYKMNKFAKGSTMKILVLCCFVTYIFSLLVNNLTTILVIVPMTLNLALLADFDPKPVIIGEIISSNLGGASTMVGDFPNMLISAETNVTFNDFIFFMMPICLILFGVLLIYLKLTTEKMDMKMKIDVPKGKKINKAQKPEFTPKEWKAIRRAVFVLIHVIFLFSISPRLSLQPSAIALFGGLSLFLFSGINRTSIYNRIGFNDILFFVGLFIMVGGIEASGLIHYISQGIAFLSLGKPWFLCLILMWSAAFVTSILSAGPTTAFFFPIVAGVAIAPSHHIIWWSLSLGVLAGSSSTIVGATSGPVATGLVENFCSLYRINLKDGNTILYSQFTKIGIPIMFLFLGISSIYILWLYAKLS